jgi:hypothetical protein
MSKPWLETWEAEIRGARCLGVRAVGIDEDGNAYSARRVETDSGVYPPDADCGRFIAAAPMLVRALLAVECRGHRAPCAYCHVLFQHDAGCPVDAALTAAGLPDQASRDEARREIAEMGR